MFSLALSTLIFSFRKIVTFVWLLHELLVFIEVLKIALIKIYKFPRKTSGMNLSLVKDYTDQHFDRTSIRWYPVLGGSLASLSNHKNYSYHLMAKSQMVTSRSGGYMLITIFHILTCSEICQTKLSISFWIVPLCQQAYSSFQYLFVMHSNTKVIGN